jgi:flavodoxin
VKALVVYESLYGNTHEIAEAVAEGLRETAEVAVQPVAETSPAALAGVDLLVVGGPTHVHGMSSDMSRRAAAESAKKKSDEPEPDVEGPALRKWFDELGKTDHGRGAAFDTRLGKPKVITGSAAKGIARRLRRHGYDIVGDESFVVDDAAGPLHEGERERAKEWGKTLARVT